MQDKILLAIGDKNLQSTLATILKENGFLTEEVLNSRDALIKIKNWKPALVLVDINLPSIENYELFTADYINKDVAKTPMIIISNTGDPIQMKKIPSTPMIKDYIIKFHIEPSEIVQKINKALGRADTFLDNKNNTTTTSQKSEKILWVEDDKLLGNILSRKLESTGYKLLRAVTGKEALNLLDTEKPDIIILDILLPEMSGFDILQAIKKKENLKGVPVIILSNLSRQTDIDKAKKMGANRYLVKAAVSLDEIIKETEEEMSMH